MVRAGSAGNELVGGGEDRRVFGDGEGEGVAVVFAVGERALEAVGRDGPEERAGVAPVREGVRDDVAGLAEQEGEQGGPRIPSPEEQVGAQRR